MAAELKIEIRSLDDLPRVAKELLDAFKEKIFLIDAPMGAGKTTLIKELCRSLGSTDHFSSPTFSIVNEYSSPGGSLYHFDLYRLKHTDELYDMGIEEYLDSGHYCFFEWPSLVEGIIENNFVKIEMQVKENIRYLHANKI